MGLEMLVKSWSRRKQAKTILYDYEGKGEVKFALAADGNLWMWNHQIGSMTGVVFQFAPQMGFLAGLFIVLIVMGINRLKGKTHLIN
jgi:hypothetical protein